MRKALVSAIYLSAASLALASDLGGDGLGGPTLQPRANSAQLGEPGLSNRETAQVDPVLIEAGEPALDFRFAENKWMRDSVSNKQSLITFSRSAAQSPGTYVGADGLIHDAVINFILYSEQFDNAAWVKSGATVEANQENSPDGKQTADRFTPTATSAVHSLQRASPYSDSGNFSNYSLYVKADGYSKIALRESKSYGSYVSFDLSTGTVIDAATVSSGKLEGYGIENVGNGWYRIHANFGDLTLHRWGLFALPENYTSGQPASSWLANGTDGYLIWGAQLEETDPATMAPTAYIKTTSQALAAPRFDHEPTTGNVTTNLVTYSEMFDQWNAWSNASVTTNVAEAPDGTTTADRITFDGTTNGRVERATSATGTVTQSVYLRTESGTQEVKIGPSSGSLTTYTVDTTWQRYTHTGTGSYPRILSNDAGSVLAWGAQLEASPTAGTYVRTLSETRSISDAVAPSLGLLVEEQRANLVTHSEDFSNAAWQKTSIVFAPTTETIDPSGQTNAYTLDPINTPNNSYVIFNSSSVTGSFSAFLKEGTEKYALLIRGTYASGDYAVFDLQSGTITQSPTFAGSTATIVDAGNGWYRCTIISTQSTTVNAFSVSGAATGISTSSAGYVYVYGAQLETETFPTSYIPTTGTSQTRYADIAAVQDEDFSTTNLISYSESFDVGWTRQSLQTVTPNAIASPDGQTTADAIVPTSGTGAFKGLYVADAFAAPRTLSVYVKKGAAPYAFLLANSGASNAWFDLTNGTVGTVGSNLKGAHIQSLDDGWFRISATRTSTTAVNVGFYFSDSDGSTSYTGDGATVAGYLWGASLTATEYPVEYTTTRNLLTDSQDFERWTKVNNATVDNDVAQAPDGTISADRITYDGTIAGRIENYTSTAIGTNTQSVYLRTESGTHQIQIGATSASLSTVTVTTEWQRFTHTGTGQYPFIRSDVAGSVLAWGAQLEPGTTATDYVRTVDVVGKAYGFYEPTEGTVYGIQSRAANTDNAVFAMLYDGTSSNRVELRSYQAGNARFLIVSGGSTQMDQGLGGPVNPIGSPNYHALSYKHNDSNVSINATIGTQDTSVIVPIVDRLELRKATFAVEYNGHIKRLTYWPVRQADSTLQVITE